VKGGEGNKRSMRRGVWRRPIEGSVSGNPLCLGMESDIHPHTQVLPSLGVVSPEVEVCKSSRFCPQMMGQEQVDT
jgi:hypothetical protein